MRDPGEIFTKRGTPVVLIVSRVGFALFFLFAILTLEFNWFGGEHLEPSWIAYLIALYIIAERVYLSFGRQGIDLAFAFPLLLSVFLLNLFSVIVDGQEKFPLLNRAEHFTTFVLTGYVVWVFFIQYLPQKVWRRHPYYTALLVLAVSSFLGVMNEIVELMMDMLLGTNTIGGEFDTPLDLLMNTLGTGTFLAVRLIIGASSSDASKQT